MSSHHDEQALAAYVVGALDPGERAEVEAHLAGCRGCTAEARSLQRVVDALARAVPLRTPRPEVRARVLEAVGAGIAERASRDRADSRISAWWFPPRWLPAAAALVLVVAGLAVYARSLQNRVASLESRLGIALTRAAAAERATVEARRVADESLSAMAVLAAPDLARIDLTGQAAAPRASGRALWSRRQGMVFTASDLPAAPAGRVYQVWVVTAQGPVSAGLLEPGVDGRDLRVFSTPPDIPAPIAVAVTLEPAGGVPAPTGERFLLGAPAPSL